jgi:hypothetical protein
MAKHNRFLQFDRLECPGISTRNLYSTQGSLFAHLRELSYHHELRVRPKPCPSHYPLSHFRCLTHPTYIPELVRYHPYTLSSPLPSNKPTSSKYKSWRITFFLVWGNLFFTTAWILRSTSSYNPQNASLYTAQYRFIITAAPIYAAAEYNILGRLLRYLPMHIPFHPDRVVYVFIFVGVVVEVLLGTGASLVSVARLDHHGKYKTGRILLAVAFLLEAFVEVAIFCFVVVIHRRCLKSGTFPKSIQRLCILLYGTSILVLLLCL